LLAEQARKKPPGKNTPGENMTYRSILGGLGGESLLKEAGKLHYGASSTGHAAFCDNGGNLYRGKKKKRGRNEKGIYGE